MNPSDVEITAGLGGFLVLFGLALVVWFLGRDLSRRLRRMRQAQSEAQAQAQREEQAQGELTLDQREPSGREQPGQPSQAGAQENPASTDPPVSPPRP